MVKDTLSQAEIDKLLESVEFDFAKEIANETNKAFKTTKKPTKKKHLDFSSLAMPGDDMNLLPKEVRNYKSTRPQPITITRPYANDPIRYECGKCKVEMDKVLMLSLGRNIPYAYCNSCGQTRRR